MPLAWLLIPLLHVSIHVLMIILHIHDPQSHRLFSYLLALLALLKLHFIYCIMR